MILSPDSLQAAGYPPPPGGFGPPQPPGGYGAPPPGGYGVPPGGMGGGYPPGAYGQQGYGPQVPIMYSDPGECALARQALMYAIIGLFCFGPVLGAIAISKARSANMIIAGNPGMRGGGMAQAALILGIVDIVLTVAAIGCNVALSGH